MAARLQLSSRLLRVLSPSLRGKTRLGKALLGKHLQTRDVEIHARYDSTFLVPSLAEPIAFHLLADGVYEGETLEFLLKHLRPGSAFVDIGANIGAFAVPVARRVGSTGRVVAVEASPRVYPYLERNVELNGARNISLKHCAASDHFSEAAPFYEAPVSQFGMGALASQFDMPPILVQTNTLDTLLAEEAIARVDVLKVDVEGFEAAVFRGASQLLSSSHPPLVVFEFCDWAEGRVPGGAVGDAQQLMLDYGYSLWRLSDFGHGGPLKEVVRTGYEMVVAYKGSASSV